MTLIRRREQGLARPADFDPFGALSLLDEFWPMARMNEETGYLPTMEVKETDDAYAIRLELPGVAKEDVRVQFENGILTVSGEKRDTTEEKSERVYRSEIRYGAFTRSLRFKEVDGEKISAKHENGVLTVTVPKSAKVQPRAIEIA
ncbi:MAG: Hsp20/alpha crystallin family protein [Nitrospinae bacterium]|nr:Hsp20/alpha crystallin family protein [Nitrospinota bacterium]